MEQEGWHIRHMHGVAQGLAGARVSPNNDIEKPQLPNVH